VTAPEKPSRKVGWGQTIAVELAGLVLLTAGYWLAETLLGYWLPEEGAIRHACLLAGFATATLWRSTWFKRLTGWETR